jgi:AcrR family transcriptional regulator
MWQANILGKMQISTSRAERRSQAERRDEAEQRLLGAAIRLVAEQGLDRITLADVGEAAGYSRGLPAHYFGNKAGLIVALAKHLIDNFSRAMDRSGEHGRGLARLLGAVNFYLDSVVKDPVRSRALFVLLGEGLANPLVSEPIAALNARSVDGFEANLRASIAMGEVRSTIDARAQATLILAALRGLVGLWLLAPQAVAMAAARDEFVASLKRSLAS